MTQRVSIEYINDLDAGAFVGLLGGVYEHSPWVAEAVVNQRPFASKASLQEAMKNICLLYTSDAADE